MSNPFSLNDLTILVTGASAGIGKQIAISCAQMGGKMVITGRDEARLQQTLEQLAGEGHQAIQADLATPEGREKVVACCPPLNGLVNNAGIAMLRPFKFTDDERLENVININLKAPYALTRDLLKKRKILSGASIVFMSSLGPLIGTPGISAYSVSKMALVGLTRTLSKELVSNKIRVNSIAPGMVKTQLADDLIGIVDKELYDADVARYPLGYGEPEDVANATVFLLSNASRWITGTNLIADGGIL